MRKTVRDWQSDWITTNGKTNDLEVVIKDSALDELAPYVYEGSFSEIDAELLDRKVIHCGRIIESTVPKRNGAYSLTI